MLRVGSEKQKEVKKKIYCMHTWEMENYNECDEVMAYVM